jgi:hypothetical protein
VEPYVHAEWSQHDADVLTNYFRQVNQHKGQLKLLLSEIDFLTNFARHHDTVVYAGAECGSHLPILARMFKDLQLSWHLFDPSPFDKSVYDWQESCRQQLKDPAFDDDNDDGHDQGPAKSKSDSDDDKSSPREKIIIPFVKVHHRSFTAQDAQSFVARDGRHMLFISDIRTLPFTRARSSESRSSTPVFPEDEQVMHDQAMQREWVLGPMQPRAACLKFRGPYTYRENEHLREFWDLQGELRVQAWARANSTELRLVCTWPYRLKRYDSQHLEEAMAYYNRHDRVEGMNDSKLQDFVLSKYQNFWLLSEATKSEGMKAFRSFENEHDSSSSRGKGNAKTSQR